MTELTVSVKGTKSTWTGLRGWLDECYRVGNVPRASEAQFRRLRLLFRSLESDHIDACVDVNALIENENFLRSEAHERSYLFTRLRRVARKNEIGSLVILVHNRRRAVETGKAFKPQREKGPRFDPARIPDDKLEHLIQTHKRIEVVEKLRKERRRRQQRNASSEVF